MQLNYEGRQKLRKEVEKKLALVPEGERIELPKETLEQLLFEFCDLKLSDDGKGLGVKYLVWSGEFLKKVDLSNVSFEKVFWNVLGDPYSNYSCFGVKRIHLSGTNVRIDFEKTFSGINSISGCNFSGVDLSNNVIDISSYDCVSISDSNFDNTGIKFICEDVALNPGIFQLSNSSFRNVDFFNLTIDVSDFEYGGDHDIRNCDFYNSGLKIDFGEKPTAEMLEFLKKNKTLFERTKYNPYKNDITDELGDELIKEIITVDDFGVINFWCDNFEGIYGFNKYLKKGYLAGCYVNGKKIPTPEERETKKSQLLSEYQKFEDETISSVLGEVDTAIKTVRKK